MRQRSLSVLLAAATGLAMTGLMATPANAMAGVRGHVQSPAADGGSPPSAGEAAGWAGSGAAIADGGAAAYLTAVTSWAPQSGGTSWALTQEGATSFGGGAVVVTSAFDTSGVRAAGLDASGLDAAGFEVVGLGAAAERLGSAGTSGADAVDGQLAAVERDERPGRPVDTKVWAGGTGAAADARTVSRAEATEEAAPSRRPASQYV